MARRRGYGQFCPVAKAAEIVAERWTSLVLRELLCGSHRFNEVRRGVPLMSPSLLSQRLTTLVDAGIVERRWGPEGAWEYHATPAGEELRPVTEMLGRWGHRHALGTIDDDDLDPALLMWDIRRRVDSRTLPPERRTVVQFDLAGVAGRKKRWWLVGDRGEIDLCLKYPGFEVDLYVAAHIRELVEVWLGKRDLASALRSGAIALEGPGPLVDSFRSWFGLGALAGA